MRSVLLFNAGAATGDVLETGLFGADHVEDLAEVVAVLVAFNVQLSFCLKSQKHFVNPDSKPRRVFFQI